VYHNKDTSRQLKTSRLSFGLLLALAAARATAYYYRVSGFMHPPAGPMQRLCVRRATALLLAIAALVLLMLCPACQGGGSPKQATLALTGDFRGFQRPCG
jgi:hypothetical protein